MKTLRVIAFVCACIGTAFSQSTVTVSGHLITGSGGTSSSNVSVLWELINDSGQICKVSATGIIVPTSFSVTQAQLAAGISLIPNNLISCGSTLGVNRWRFTVKAGGIGTRQCSLNITGNTNLDSVSCLNALPTTPIPATGDSLYCRIDGTNCGFTGPISGTSAVFSGNASIGGALGVTGNFTLGGTLAVNSLTASGITTVSNLNTIQMADRASGADWCAKTNTALAAGSQVWVNQNATPGTCSVNITIPDSSVVHLTQAGTYTLGTANILPGNNSGLVCDVPNIIISYSGTSGAAWDVNTVTQAFTEGCNFLLGANSATLGMRFRNSGNSFETRAKVRRTLISAAARTAGQIGVLLQATTAIASVYHSDLDFSTNNIDIGVEFTTTNNTQGPNANRVNINCNGHSICVQDFDGTDNWISGTILGGVSSPKAFNLCAAGNGGYGVSNTMFGPFSTEQGVGSTTFNIASAAGLTVGCGNSLAVGQSNDVNGITDANAVSTVGWFQNGGGFWHLLIADNFLAFGGARVAGSAGIGRNGTGMEAKLGDQSAFTTMKATQFISSIATGTAPFSITSTTPVPNLNASPVAYNAAGTQFVNTHNVWGSSNLASGTPSTVIVTLSGAAVFSNNASYKCTLTNETTAADTLKITYTDGSHFTITGPNTVTDSVTWSCTGF